LMIVGVIFIDFMYAHSTHSERALYRLYIVYIAKKIAIWWWASFFLKIIKKRQKVVDQKTDSTTFIRLLQEFLSFLAIIFDFAFEFSRFNKFWFWIFCFFVALPEGGNKRHLPDW
jgi:hypothetical protein